MEFDKLLGKVGPYEDSNGDTRAMSDSDINSSSEFELPFLTKKQQHQMTQNFKQDEILDTQSLLCNYMDPPGTFNSRCLQMMVPAYRLFHHVFNLKPKPLEEVFIRPE